MTNDQFNLLVSVQEYAVERPPGTTSAICRSAAPRHCSLPNTAQHTPASSSTETRQAITNLHKLNNFLVSRDTARGDAERSTCGAGLSFRRPAGSESSSHPSSGSAAKVGWVAGRALEQLRK